MSAKEHPHRLPTTDEKLQLAREINEIIEHRCEGLGLLPGSMAEVLVLALYARTDTGERSVLLGGGLK